jgi:serine/threonine protein kinase
MLNINRGEESSAGTLLYLPPEIITGGDTKSSPAIDIWAIGVTAF